MATLHVWGKIFSGWHLQLQLHATCAWPIAGSVEVFAYSATVWKFVGTNPFVVFRRSGSEKGVFWKRGLFRKVHFLEILENLEILEILENAQTVENKGEADHFLEILENLEILEILEIPLVKRPLS